MWAYAFSPVWRLACSDRCRIFGVAGRASKITVEFAIWQLAILLVNETANFWQRPALACLPGPDLDPNGHCHTLCHPSIVPGGCRGSSARGALRQAGLSWFSCGEALSILTARGRLWSLARASLCRVSWARPRGPLSCPREGGVDKGLLQFQFPAGLQFLRQSTQDALQPAFPTHCWKRRWQV